MAKKYFKHPLREIFEGTTYYDFYADERDGNKIEKEITRFDKVPSRTRTKK